MEERIDNTTVAGCSDGPVSVGETNETCVCDTTKSENVMTCGHCDCSESEMNERIAKSLEDGLKYRPVRFLLVKPLELKKVSKTITKAVFDESKQKGNKMDLTNPNSYKTVESVEEVESDWREGIVISVPEDLVGMPHLYTGAKIIFKNKTAQYFDLYKDSVLVNPFDVAFYYK